MIQLSADEYEFASTEDRQRKTAEGQFCGYIKGTDPPDGTGWVLLQWKLADDDGETINHCLWARAKTGADHD